MYYSINIDKMKTTMTEKRWRAADVIAITGLSGETVRNLIKGRTSRIYLDTAVKVAKALGIPIQDFIVKVRPDETVSL